VDRDPRRDRYRVERSNPGAEKYTQVGDVLVATTLVDGELPEGRGFDYRVVAVNAAGDSDASNVATAYTVPPAVANVAAAAAGTTITVTWDPSDAATGYVVERSLDGLTDWASAGTTTSATTLADAGPANTGLAHGTTYHYRVVAANAAGSSALSNVAFDTTAPAAPANPTATATGTAIAVAWDAAAGATGYLVERSADGVNGWASVGSTTSATTLTDAGLANGTAYHYRVTASNDAGRLGSLGRRQRT
jgi:titin